MRLFRLMLITLTPVEGFVTTGRWADRVIPKACESFAAVSLCRMPAGSRKAGVSGGIDATGVKVMGIFRLIGRLFQRPKTIFHIGMHIGQETAFYLAKGFRVIAIEASPLLV